MRGFIEFIREKGVVGLAVGFILGSAISKVVTSLVADIVTPTLGIILGVASGLKEAYVQIGPAKIRWGNFTNTMIDFLAITFVVYFGVKLFRLDRLDKKKEIKK